jgi:hypothetical protein
VHTGISVDEGLILQQCLCPDYLAFDFANRQPEMEKSETFHFE